MTATDETTESGVPVRYDFTHRQIQVVLIGLMAGSFLAALDQTIVATALPRIVGDFGGVDQLAWIASIYLLTSTAAMPIVGKLSDLYGRRLLFQISIVVFMLGSLMAGGSQTMGQLIASRAVQGFGAGGLIVLNFGVLADIVAPRERGRYQGYVASVWAVAAVIGPLLGGFFVDNLTWRWIFFVNLPIGVAALLITSAALKLPKRDRSDVSIDYLGAGLLVAAIVSLLLVTEWGGDKYEWVSLEILGLLAASLLFTLLFVWCERRAADPIIPPRLFRIPTFRINATGATVFGMLMFGTILFVPVYFQIVRGDTATNAGLLLLPQMIGILVGTIAAGRLTTSTGRYKIFPLVGLTLLGASFFVLSRIQPDTPQWFVAICMVFVGAGVGMTAPALILSVQNAVDTDDIGAANVGDHDGAVDGLVARRGSVRRRAQRPAELRVVEQSRPLRAAASIPRCSAAAPSRSRSFRSGCSTASSSRSPTRCRRYSSRQCRSRSSRWWSCSSCLSCPCGRGRRCSSRPCRWPEASRPLRRLSR